MTEQRVSSRYANAILDVAIKEGIEELVFNDFVLIGKSLEQSKELSNLTHSPVIAHWQKKNVFKDIFEGKVNQLTLNFLVLLIEKRREGLLLSIAQKYYDFYNTLKNNIEAEVSSAVALDDDMREKIKQKITASTGKNVLLNFVINKSLIGGVSIKINDSVFDASVKSSLEMLKKQLAYGGISA